MARWGSSGGRIQASRSPNARNWRPSCSSEPSKRWRWGSGWHFLLFGYSTLKAGSQVSEFLTRGAHLAIAWLVMNWWAHDGLHQHIGMALAGLLGIEYIFHFTLIVSSVILARFFLAVVRAPAGSPA